jgi:peroxiredoxin
LGLDFPLLSNRDRDVIRAYGVYDDEKDTARRAYFLIDKDGKIVWQHIMANHQEKLDKDQLLKAVADSLQ